MRTVVYLVLTPVLFFVGASFVVGLVIGVGNLDPNSPLVSLAGVGFVLLAVVAGVIYGWRNRWN